MPLTISDKIILITFIVGCLIGFWPSVKNFLAALKEKNNPKLSGNYRLFVIGYLGLGVLAIVFVFLFSVYSIVIRWK